jgi:hypothetical protein
MVMRGGADHPRARGAQERRLEQRVQFSRGHWRQEQAGAIRSAGWWESVTVTWSPAAAPERGPRLLHRALASAFDALAPSIAEFAAASARGLIERQRGRGTALPSRRPLFAVARRRPAAVVPALPRSDQAP